MHQCSTSFNPGKQLVMKNKLLPFIPLLLISCTKYEVVQYESAKCYGNDIDLSNDKKLELVWQSLLKENKDSDISPYISTILLDDEVAFFYNYDNEIIFVDKVNRNITGHFEDPNSSLIEAKSHPEYGLIAFSNKSVHQGKNFNSFGLIHTFEEHLYPESRFMLFEDDAYFSFGSRGAKGAAAWIKSLKLKDHSIREWLYKNAEEEWPGGDTVVHSSAPAAVNINGRKLLFLNYRKIWDNYWQSQSYFECYELGDNPKLLWKKDSIYIWTQNHTAVYKNNVISLSSYGLISYDPFSSKILWTVETPPNKDKWLIKNIIILGNKIYLLDHERLLEIDADSGNVLYESKDLFSSQSNSGLTYFDGVLYWTGSENYHSYIFGLRVDDKKMVVKMRSPNLGKGYFCSLPGFGDRGIQIEEKTRLLYTNDGFFAQCFRIPNKYE